MRSLCIVMYHYVGDFARAGFRHLRALSVDEFRRQVDDLQAGYEIASLESALAFVEGRYAPPRPLCLLTFDDGLSDHYQTVMPLLVERGIEGAFFVISGCCESGQVAAVHKSHFLAAALGFEAYRAEFLRALPGVLDGPAPVADPAVVARTYRWDPPDVGGFKYLVNFGIEAGVRDRVLDTLFARHLGAEAEFARWLYLSWTQARDMQRTGMVLGGHSHAHRPLARLTAREQEDDIGTCARLLRERLHTQTAWPFAYPYGKADTFNTETVRILRECGFACAFASTPGEVHRGDHVYTLARMDTVAVLPSVRGEAGHA